MALKHAVLGLVIERPGYGYQLSQRLDARCPAWGWERSGVYGALDSLASDSHVRSVGEKGSSDSGRAARRTIYEATPEGRDFFHDWMRSPSSANPVRPQELDLKIQLAGPEFLPQLIDETLAQEHHCMAELQRFASVEQGRHSGLPKTWAEASVLLQRDGEIKLLRLRVEWLQQARRVMTLMSQQRLAK